MEEKTTLYCPLCKDCRPVLFDTFGREEIIHAYSNIGLEVSDYFESYNTIEIYSCQKTNYRFYHPKEVIGDAKFYEHLNQVIGSENYYFEDKWEYQIAKNAIAKHNVNTILDIGCGGGEFLQYFTADYEVVGIEYNEKALELLRSKGITHYKIMIEEFSEAEENQNKFDVITAFQVLEHIYDANSFISAILKCLKPGGLLIFGTPNNTPYIYGHDRLHPLNLPPHHMGLWNYKSLRKLELIFPIDTLSTKIEPYNSVDLERLVFYLSQKKLGLKWGEKIYFRVFKKLPPLLKTFAFLFRKRNRNVISIYKKRAL